MAATGKDKLEVAAVSYFLDWYARTFRIVCHQDRPDFLVQEPSSGEKVGIEVAHLFQDDEEARMLLGRSQEWGHSTVTSSDLITRLNDLLRQKAQKVEDYDFAGSLFLLIRVASPTFDRESFVALQTDINIPFCRFSEIWLLFYDFNGASWSDLMQLK